MAPLPVSSTRSPLIRAASMSPTLTSTRAARSRGTDRTTSAQTSRPLPLAAHLDALAGQAVDHLLQPAAALVAVVQGHGGAAVAQFGIHVVPVLLDGELDDDAALAAALGDHLDQPGLRVAAAHVDVRGEGVAVGRHHLHVADQVDQLDLVGVEGDGLVDVGGQGADGQCQSAGWSVQVRIIGSLPVAGRYCAKPRAYA